MNVKPKYNLQIFDTVQMLSAAAAEFIIGVAKQSIEERGCFVIALSGGHTPETLYALMAEPPYLDRMPWEQTFVWWGDERCVPMYDPCNNAHMARGLLLDKVSTHIHTIPVYLSPAEAAKDYEDEINTFFGDDMPRFDLILLGLGTNGHTASLFPGTEVVNEKAIGIREVYLEDDKMYRITMTASLINLARNAFFLVAGAEKTSILKTVLTGEYKPALYPAQMIQPKEGALYWFVDKEAAGEMR